MRNRKTLTLPVLLCALTLHFQGGRADVIAATNFDAYSPNSGGNGIADDLNWVANGVQDPGPMVVLNASSSPQVLFTINDTVNVFSPGLNTGNGDTFWSAYVSLTVLPGYVVTLTDVTLNAVSISGSQVFNVDRRNDYTVTLFDPSAVLKDTIDVPDILAGTSAGQPLVTFTFGSPIQLSEPGAYSLRIQGGDYIGTGETGNHTAFDNLSINGTAVVVPEPSPFILGLLGFFAWVWHRRHS